MQSKIRNRILAFFLAVLFISHYGSVSLFQHTHYVDDVLITHSHPFSGSSHSHSASSIVAISWIGSFVAIVALAFIASGVSRILLYTNSIANDIIRSFAHKHNSPSRAPPVIC